MLDRKYLFPHVIEMNYQAGRRLGVNVYLIDGGTEFALIDIGYLDAVDEIVELIRKMDFNLSTCKMIIATHADATVFVDVVTAKQHVAHLERELALGVPGCQPDIERHVAYLDLVAVIEQEINFARRHGQIDALGFDLGEGHDRVTRFDRFDAERMGGDFRLQQFLRLG